MALVILPGLNNLIEDISEEKKLPPNIVEAALREALLKGYEKYRRTFYIGTISGSFAAFFKTEVPLAKVAAIMKFSVAPTDAMCISKVPAFKRPLDLACR